MSPFYSTLYLNRARLCFEAVSMVDAIAQVIYTVALPYYNTTAVLLLQGYATVGGTDTEVKRY